MKLFLILALSLLPALAQAGTVDVTNNVKSLSCAIGGGHDGISLKMTFSNFVDPRGVEHSQRKVSYVVSGIYFNDYYNYLVDSVTYDDQANTYTVALYGVNTPDATLTLQVQREDVPELAVGKTSLPAAHSGYCTLSGEAKN